MLFWSDPWVDIAAMQHEAATYCRLSTDRADFSSADAVIFPLPTSQGRMPTAKGHPDQLWVLWSQESAVHFPALDDPTFCGQFDLRATYRLDSDVPIPYIRWYSFDHLAPIVPLAERRTVLASAWVSSGWDRCGRDDYLRQLMQHVQIDSYGKVEHNIDVVDDRGPATKLATIAGYRFTIAFENSVAHDYVTEKLFQPLLAGSVPIYRGAPNVAEFLPAEHCCIDANSFSSPEALGEFLTSMTDDEYAGYHRWRSNGADERFTTRLRRFDGVTMRRLVRAVTAVQLGRRVASVR